MPLSALSVLLLAGCGSEAPFGVDPSLRESANRYAVAVTQGDRASLAQMGIPGEQDSLDGIVGTFGGHTTTPWAYSSEDRGHASVWFDVTCGQGTATLMQTFVYRSGVWRPLLDTTVHSDTTFPAASPATGPPPSPTPEPACS